MANNPLRSHPSAMTADQYYDAESKKNVSEQTDEVLGYNSVPFYERPLDSDESDRIVGKDEAGNFIRQTILGNRYTVSLNPDQRTTRTKIEEDVIPAVKKFADDPRFPTGKEVGDVSRAIVKEVIDTASIPGDLLTGKRSPIDVQMGDVFELAGGTNLIGAKEVLPDNAMGVGLGVFKRKTKPYTTSSISLNTDIEDVGTIKDVYGEAVEEFHSSKKSGGVDFSRPLKKYDRARIANEVFNETNFKDFVKFYSTLDPVELKKQASLNYFTTGEFPNLQIDVDIYADKIMADWFESVKDSADLSELDVGDFDAFKTAVKDNLFPIIDNFRTQQYNLVKTARKVRDKNASRGDKPVPKEYYDLRSNQGVFKTTETEQAFPSTNLVQERFPSGRPSGEAKETITFARPISEYVKSGLMFPGKNNKKGDATILGSAFLKDIQTNLNITEQSFPKSFLDLQKKYTKEELIELVEEKEFKTKAVQNDSTLRTYQPQSKAGYIDGVERENFIFPIESTTGTGKKFSPKRTHFNLGDTMIAHVRGQIIDPKPVTDSSAFIPPLIKGTLNSDDRPTAFTDAINNEPYLLGTEFQTDLLQKGYDKANVDPVQKALKVFAGYNLPYGMSSKEIFKDENLPTLEKILREGKSLDIFPTDLLGLKKQNFRQEQISSFSNPAEEFEIDKGRGYIDEKRFDLLTSSLDTNFKTSYLNEDSIRDVVQTAVDNRLNISAYEKTFTVPEISASASVEVDKSFLNNTTPASQVYNQGDSESLTASLFREENKKLQKAVTRIAEEDSPERRSAIAIVDIFEQTTIGEFSSMTQDWLNFGEENTKKVLNFQVNADDIGGRTQGELGDPGTISMFAENLARKKLGLSLVEEGSQEFRGRFDGYPDDINGYFRLVNAYSNMVFESLYTNKGLFKVVTDPKVTEKFVKETTADILKIRKEQILEDDKIQNFFDGYATETLSASDLKVAYQKTTDTFNSALNQENVVNPPVKKDISKQITDEMFKVLLIKAATSGVTKIVIPNTTRMAMAERFSVREKMPKSFTKIMDDFLPKTISEFAKNYEGVNVQEVDLPYQDSNNSNLGSTASGYIAKAREEGREVSKTGTVIDISEFLKNYKVDPDGSVRQFAEGGLTMNQQTEEAFPLDFSFSKGPKSSFGEVTSPNINLGKGNINVSLMGSKNKNNQEYPDGVIVDTENKTVGFSINGKAVFSRDGDKYFQAGFKKMNNKTEEKVNLPSGEELEFKDGSVGKSYNFEAGLGDLVVKGSKQSSDTGKSQYSGQVIYRLNDNAEIFIEDTNTQDAKVGFSAKYNFAKGGLTDMNEQTQMAFALGGEAETRDPVSGNDIPPGSLPVEVRDDIPARLSEGEYVVPADVVRFFGVKFFEDLRTEAKQGLQQMDMDGRIGGEPISEGPQMQSGAMSDQDIDSLIDSEMQSSEMSDQDIDSLIDSEIKNMNQGGMVGQKNPTNSMYSDPNKTDQVISKLSSAASQDPEFSRMLRERGISVPNTNATQTPDQMQDANRPDMSQQPKMVANKGGLMGYDKGGDTSSSDSTNMADYFDVNDFDAEKYKENLLSTKKGGITRIEVTTPGGGRMFMYWDISLPLPKGYALVSAKKASTKSEDKGNDRDRDPAPKNIDVSKLSLADLQIIKLDVQRKKATLFGLAGPFAIPIYNRAMKDIEDAVAGHTKYVNSLEDGAAKTEGLKRLRNYEEGVDVLTGKDLAEMPGMFAVLKGDLRNISDKFGESSEEEVAEISLEKRITGIYTKEANLAGGQKIKPEDSVFAKTLNLFAKQSNEVQEIKPVEVDPVVEVEPVEAAVDGTSTAATNNAASNINLEGYNGSASASFRYDEGGNLKSFLGGNFDVAGAGNGYQAYIDRQIAAEDAGQRNSSSNDDFKEMHRQAMANAGGGDRADQQAIDTGFGSGDIGGKDDDYGSGEGQDLGGYGFLNKGGLIGKPQKTSYDKGGYVTSKKTKQRTNGLASRP